MPNPVLKSLKALLAAIVITIFLGKTLQALQIWIWAVCLIWFDRSMHVSVWIGNISTDVQWGCQGSMWLPYCTVGAVLARWWEVPGVCSTPVQKVQFVSHQIRESFSSCSQSPLNAVWQTPSSLSYAFYSKWLPSSHSTIKTCLMERCWDELSKL